MRWLVNKCKNTDTKITASRAYFLCKSTLILYGNQLSSHIEIFLLLDWLPQYVWRTQTSLLFTLNRKQKRRIDAFTKSTSPSKPKQPCLGFELRSRISFLTTITVTQSPFHHTTVLSPREMDSANRIQSHDQSVYHFVLMPLEKASEKKTIYKYMWMIRRKLLPLETNQLCKRSSSSYFVQRGEIDSCLSQGNYGKVKRKQPRSGFEPRSLISFPTTITVTHRVELIGPTTPSMEFSFSFF